jgi:hypothetical protein
VEKEEAPMMEEFERTLAEEHQAWATETVVFAAAAVQRITSGLPGKHRALRLVITVEMTQEERKALREALDEIDATEQGEDV